MAYEYRSIYGLVRLLRTRQGWRIEFGKAQVGNWGSAESAVSALIERASGIADWDGIEVVDVPEDIVDWTPLTDSL